MAREKSREAARGQAGQQEREPESGQPGERRPARRGGPRGLEAPFGPLWASGTTIRRLFDDFDRLFEDMQRRVFGAPPTAEEGWLARPFEGPPAAAWAPRIEVRDTGREIVVTAELPGVDPKDVQVECTDEGVVIRGETRQERSEEEGGFFRSERRYGSFLRQVPLPADLELDRAQASFENGLLRVRVPKSEAAQQRVRRIPITGGAGAEPGTSPSAGGASGRTPEPGTEPGAERGAQSR